MRRTDAVAQTSAMMLAAAPLLRDIVLLGGGHAHVQVLKRFGMQPEPGLRLTVVAREPHSPYSGMLPGFIAGHYAWDDIHIDLVRLAAFAGARFIAAEATGLDLKARRIDFSDRPPLRYDVLSINTGGVPGERFASDFVTPVKPIGRFLPVWQRLTTTSALQRLAIVGSGPGGVELALAFSNRCAAVGVVLVEAGAEILQGFAPSARSRLLKALARCGVAVETDFRVVKAAGGRVYAEDGRSLAADHVLWTTGVEAPPWIAAAGLATDSAGFVAIDPNLQSTSHPGVFAAGDVATTVDAPRPKSGVYAVRQGPVLARNLCATATGRRLCVYRPQRRALAVVGLGGENAVASRGWLYASGRWIWLWKRWIDQRFMARFNNLPQMTPPKATLPPTLQADAPQVMRCGGCGAKLGADLLRRVLDRLAVDTSPATVRGIGDDAALVQVHAGNMAMSCDGFRAMIDDPYRFGRIGAHHALNDLFAMGARPTFALALATVPTMAGPMMEEDLFQMMAGALAVLRRHGVDLVGGHSAEGVELGIAFSVVGVLDGPALAKDGLQPGNKLVLTKPIGTGALLAAAMQGRAQARDVVAAIECMDASSAAAVTILREHGVTGCTDVTGFGLAGHLAEMARASHVGVRLDAGRVPRLAGVLDVLSAGIASSLQANNEKAIDDFTILGAVPNAPEVGVLADPQTAGGLLAGIPEHRADQCVAALRRAGYAEAEEIGEVGGRERVISVT